VMQGGKFGHGFLAAGITKGFSKSIGVLKTVEGKVFAAAILGGTASKISGGKFANGAITGAFSRLFNDEKHKSKQQKITEAKGIVAEKISEVNLKGGLMREYDGASANQPLGAIVREADGLFYIDPQTEGNRVNYLVPDGLQTGSENFWDSNFSVKAIYGKPTAIVIGTAPYDSPLSVKENQLPGYSKYLAIKFNTEVHVFTTGRFRGHNWIISPNGNIKGQ